MSQSNLISRSLAVVAVAGISTLAFAPAAMAAGTVSTATATALSVSIAGNGAGTGPVTATNDGDGEKVSGDTELVGALPGNAVLDAGVAVQNPSATVSGQDGISWSCAGVAGDGGGVVETGDPECQIRPGQPVSLSLANLNLGTNVLDADSAIGSALNGTPLKTLLEGIPDGLNTLTGAVGDAIADTPLALSIGGSLGAIEARCYADPYAASGTATIVNTAGSGDTPITLKVGDQQLTLLNLPANPPPNTTLKSGPVITDTVIGALQTELNTALTNETSGPLAALGDALGDINDAVVRQLITQLQPVLDAVNDNLLQVNLNTQARSDDGRKIEVTALDLQVLPAAAQAIGSSAIEVKAGQVSCGPNARVGSTGNPGTESPNGNAGSDVSGSSGQEVLPTKVTAGAELASSGLDNARATVLGATGALLLLAGAGSLMRRRFSRL